MALFEDTRKQRVTIMLTREQRDELGRLAVIAGVSRSEVARSALAKGVERVREIMAAEDRNAALEHAAAVATGMFDQPPDWATDDAVNELGDMPHNPTREEKDLYNYRVHRRAMELVREGKR